MAECYSRFGSKARGTRAQFRLNTQGLLPFKCSYPVHLTDVMDIGQSSQSGLLRDAETNKYTRTRTVREYEQTISELRKENFDLKLRIFLLEEAINKNCRKDRKGTPQDKNDSVEVLIELKVETESLRKELSCKNQSLEDALEQIEKLQLELQQQQAELAELPSKEHIIVLQDENSFLQKEIENLQDSLAAKNQELEEAAHQIEELSSQNIYLEEKVKKGRIAIRGFIKKHAEELELIPQDFRPFVESAVKSAKNNDFYNLDAAIKSFKSSLCEMMSIPLKELVNDSEDKENKDANSKNMCLSGETFKSGEKNGQLKRHRSDPYVPLSNLQVASIVKPISTQTPTLEDQLIQFKESYKSIVDAVLSNNVDELKEEVLMLLLTIEEREKEISQLKQMMKNLEVELENAASKKETESDGDTNEKNDLCERLALSCSVNKELMKHLHTLEAFMEDLLHNRNLDMSSVDNISEASDMFLQLSKRLDESLKLSQVFSDHLSICEGNKVFGSEVSVSRDDISMSDTKSYQHLDLSALNLSKLDSLDEGSVSKRLFSREVSSKRDYKLEKHLSLLAEKMSKFTMVSSQLEKIKNIETEESEIVNDITDELNGLLASVNETLGKLTVIKEISKKGTPYVCEKCSIAELLLDLERTRRRIHSSNLLENINETKIEQLTQVLMSEVDDLKKQLEEPHAILSSGAENSESNQVSDKDFQKDKLQLGENIDGEHVNNYINKVNDKYVKIEAEKKLLEKRLQSHEDQIELFENELQSNKDEYLSTVEEKEKLMKDKEHLEREKGELQIQNELLLIQIKELNEKYDDVFKQLAEFEHKKDFFIKKITSEVESSEPIEKQVKELSDENESLVISLRDVENKRAVLEQEIKNVVDQLNSVKKQLIESNDKCTSCEKSRKDLEDRHKLVEEQLEERKNQNELFQKELLTREDQRIMLEGELKKLKDTGLIMEKEKEELKKESEVVRKQLEGVKSKNESQEEELSKMNYEKKLCEKKLANMQMEKGLIEQEKAVVNDKMQTLEKEKESLEAEKEKISQELKNVKCSNNILESELGKYKNEKIELIKHINEKREALSNEKIAATELKVKIGNLENYVDNLQKDNSTLNQEKQDLAEKYSNHILQLNEVEKENNNLKHLIPSMEQKNSEINKLCDQLQAELHKTKEQLLKLDLKCSEYQTQLTLESKNKKDSLSKLKMLENNLFAKQKCISELTAANGDLLKHSEIQRNKLAILEKERYNLSEQLQEKEKELSTLQAVHNELESKYATLLEEKNVVEEKLTTLTASCEELQKDLNAKGDHVQKLETKCVNYEKEVLSSSNIRNNLIQKLQTVKKELFSDSKVMNDLFGFNITETIAEKKSDSCDDLNLSKDKMIDQLCYNIIMDHHDFLKNLATNVQHLKNNSLTLEESKAKEEHLKLELYSLQRRLEFLQSELDNVSKQKGEMKNVIDEHIKTISNKEKMLMLKDSEIQSLRHQLFEIANEAENEKQQLKLLNIHEMEKGQLKEHSEHLQSVINRLQKQLLDKEKLLTDYNTKIYSLKVQLQNESKKADFQLNSKDDEVTCLQERIFNLQTQVNNLLTEKIDFDVQMDNEINKVATDAVTSTTDLLDSSMHSLVSETQRKLDKSLDASAESSKFDMHSDESFILPESQTRERERLVRKTNALQVKLSMATKRIEILEQEKSDLRDSLLAEVHARKKSNSNIHGNSNEKIAELETKLEKKVSFIKELKNDLFKTSESLVKKQEELDDLRQKMSALDNSKSELQFHKDFSSNSLSIETNISSLRKHKWELIQTIFDMQKKLYEKKGIHLNHFENFKKHIENLHSLQVSAKLSKSESEPILGSHSELASKGMFLNGRNFFNCVLVGLEIDIECLENLKIFLKRFFVPYILQNTEVVDQNAVKSGHSISVTKSSLEKSPSFNHVVEERSATCPESCASSPDFVLVESKKVRKCDALPNEWSKMAWNLSQKLDHVESILKSLDSDYSHMKKLELTLQGKSISVPIESLFQKIFNENKALIQSTKIFRLNASLKSSGIFNRNVVRISSKQDLSDHESLLSEETITLSRSGSLSPVSFEENLPVKIQSIDAAASKKDQIREKSNSKEIVGSCSSKSQNAGSSQDSVCQRSHYSSPDLGIESDPNHDSSAPEQMEKHELYKDTKAEIKIRPKLVGRQPKKSMYTSIETSRRHSDTEAFVGGDTLRAIGILQEYELLKREVQESLVGIKSVLSRTGDGLHQIAKYTSPRKNLEYSTFRAIKDTCANIEVCLKEAYKLVNNFWIAPCPSSEEWNLLIQQNQEKCDKILMLKNSVQKQEEDFKVAMNKLQQAQLVKEQMEKKISKKLVKTKKILRRAEFKLLESECQNLVPLPNFPSESSHCQENH